MIDRLVVKPVKRWNRQVERRLTKLKPFFLKDHLFALGDRFVRLEGDNGGVITILITSGGQQHVFRHIIGQVLFQRLLVVAKVGGKVLDGGANRAAVADKGLECMMQRRVCEWQLFGWLITLRG